MIELAPNVASQPEARRRLAQARQAGRRALDEPEAKRLLQSFGIAVPRGEVVADEAAALAAATRLTAPLAAKLVSQDAIHKSDIGGVRLSLVSSPRYSRCGARPGRGCRQP